MSNGASYGVPSYNYNQGFAHGGMNGHGPPSSSTHGSVGARLYSMARPYQQVGGPIFKDSPFYDIKERLGEVKVCDGMTPSPNPFSSTNSGADQPQAMSQHRHTVTIPIKLQDHPVLQQCVADKSMRVMIFCAGEGNGVQEIAFPHQSEIKVNGDEIKANLRGLKNKPGSTRPVDITTFLRLRTSYTNNIEFTYALTNKVGCTLDRLLI
jgi:E3 SUMO-protein ligase PIAS1